MNLGTKNKLDQILGGNQYIRAYYFYYYNNNNNNNELLLGFQLFFDSFKF